MFRRSRHVTAVAGLSVLVTVFTACAAGIARAQAEGDSVPDADRGRLARAITIFEIARSHMRQWESNPTAQALVAQMTEDLARQAELGITWKARLFLVEEDRSERDRDEFERTAMATLGKSEDTRQAIWNDNLTRVVSSVTAHKSCVNCHDATVGGVMAYASLTYRWKRQGGGDEGR